MNAMIGTTGRRPARGFSLLELMIVVGITLVVAAVAIPGVLTATQNFKLRSTASSASGLIQKARMLSVARNTYYPVLSSTDTTTNITSIFLGNANDFTGATTPTDNTSMIQVRGMVFDTGSHPSATSIVGTLTPVSTLPIFNPRGSPCFGNPCQADPNRMYITFLRQDRSLGTPGWAAINVTPAGRVQVWTWDGSNWQ
ncbi:MAG TPA: prepilin-type N-terminal cleavage/methylation domain-containing protein [Terriglobales bacterium]